MAPSSAPRRVRRPAPGRGETSLWDVAATTQLMAELGVKTKHAGPLFRSLGARVVSSRHDFAADRATGADCGSCCVKGPMRDAQATWEELGVTERELVVLGLPQRSSALLDVTRPFTTRVVDGRVSRDSSTSKLVLELRDGHRIETVVMRHGQRTTACVSSQIGCQMGCAFCATGTMPIVGDLRSEEIVEQLLHANATEAAAGRPPVRNVVFMGMGEPLNNYESVLRAVRTITDEHLLGKLAVQQSKVTVSTVGVISGMRRLVRDVPSVSLALSLHAPNQELREQIVPAARHHQLDELLEALDAHTANCRRPTPTSVGAMVEYVLLADVNDSDAHAAELGRLMGIRAKDVMVNLIPYNPGAASAVHGFKAPGHERVERFQQIVMAFGVTTRVRREMGRDIAGACGQLALASGASKAGKQSASGDVAGAPESLGESQQDSLDVEDFVAWRRRQPTSAKRAVNAECVALAKRDIQAGSIDAPLSEADFQFCAKLGLRALFLVTGATAGALGMVSLLRSVKSHRASPLT